MRHLQGKLSTTEIASTLRESLDAFTVETIDVRRGVRTKGTPKPHGYVDVQSEISHCSLMKNNNGVVSNQKLQHKEYHIRWEENMWLR